MNYLDRTNSQGVTVREALTVWQVQEVILCDESGSWEKELSKFPLRATLGEAWPSLTETAKQAIAESWSQDIC
jgi:hypothetical protein